MQLHCAPSVKVLFHLSIFHSTLFFSSLMFQFIIEAVLGGTQGSISIDDIVVSRVSSGSCPAERECTFQGSLCGLQSFGGLGWSRVKGSVLPANAPGPEADHTLGTDQVSVMTADMGPTAAGGECLMFWYHMEGLGDGEINIYVQTNESRTPTLLWWGSGHHGDEWHGVEVMLGRVPHDFRVRFEARTSGPGHIAIDNISFTNCTL
ncbi:hypothetical protein NL108_001155, partial [Boleophthalmus pectinirostris]